MFENRKLDHIAIACPNAEEVANWYIDVMGMQLLGKFQGMTSRCVRFVGNGEVTYEIIERPDMDPAVMGKLDHMAYVSEDIEADYKYFLDRNCTFATKGILDVGFWKNGERIFKVFDPAQGQVEFVQKL